MPKILVIEDADPLRNDIVEMLRFEDFDVRGAENGAVGVDVALEYDPDLIICDIMMPELDGYGVLERLREEETTLTTPFIFLTAKTDRFDIRRGMGKGANDYLTKPFVAEELLDTINARLLQSVQIADVIRCQMRELSNSIITALPHELRTPLNTIIGFSDMLIVDSERLSKEQVVDWSKHINSAAYRLYRLVENYLTYVRIEVARHNDADLQASKEKIVKHPDSVIQFHGVNVAEQAERMDALQMEINDSVPVQIDENDLGKIIDELLDNAFKFSKDGAVRLSAYPDGPMYVIEVEDHGRGMSQDQIDNIGAYMQFDRWIHEQQGSGLGLIIVKRIIELYGGKLNIESVIGEMTRVTVRLPVARVEQAEAV